MRSATVAAVAGHAALFVALATTSMTSPAFALPPEDRDGMEFRTSHYTEYTEAPESDAEFVAGQLEVFRATVGKVALCLRPRGSKPTVVFVFRDEKSVAPYRASLMKSTDTAVVAFFVSGPDTNFIAVKEERGRIAVCQRVSRERSRPSKPELHLDAPVAERGTSR